MSNLTIQTDDRGVTTIWLNRPDLYNAMNRALMDELILTLDKLNGNTRVLVLAGKGKHFCAGADVNWMKESVGLTEAENHADAMALSDMLFKLNTFPSPTVARVHGAALGGGTGLICCCDMVIADESATFAFSEVKLGIIPATISPYALASIGARAARRYFLTGEKINAQQAYKLGLVHEVCAKDKLDAHISGMIDTILTCGPDAQTSAKQLIPHVHGKTIDLALREQLATRLASIRSTAEAQEGLGAFLEKRSAQW